MGKLRRAGGWISTSDAALGMGERIAGWMVSAGIGGVLTTVGGTVLGWLAGNLLYGLVIGMGLGFLVLMAATFQAVRAASAGDAALRANRVAQPDKQLRTENQRLRGENERLRAEIEEFSGESDEAQLKQRCRQLSEELFQFMEERDADDPSKHPERHPGFWNRSTNQGRHDTETRTRYTERFGGQVGATLDAAQERGWIARPERKALEDNIKAALKSPTVRIREMAQRLAAIGHRL